MITYNQYPQLGVRQRPLAVTRLSWRDFLGKLDLLHPASTGSSWCHYRHLGPPLISWLCPCPPTLDSFCSCSISTLASPLFLILLYLLASGWPPLSGHLDQFPQFINREGSSSTDVSLHEGFVGSVRNVFIHPPNLVFYFFYDFLNSFHRSLMRWKHLH